MLARAKQYVTLESAAVVTILQRWMNPRYWAPLDCQPTAAGCTVLRCQSMANRNPVHCISCQPSRPTQVDPPRCSLESLLDGRYGGVTSLYTPACVWYSDEKFSAAPLAFLTNPPLVLLFQSVVGWPEGRQLAHPLDLSCYLMHIASTSIEPCNKANCTLLDLAAGLT